MAIAYRAPSVVRARVVKATKVMKARKAPAPKGRNPMKAMKGHENGDGLQAAVQGVYDYGDGEVSRALLPYKAVLEHEGNAGH